MCQNCPSDVVGIVNQVFDLSIDLGLHFRTERTTGIAPTAEKLTGRPEVESEIDREVKHLIDNAHHIAGAILAHNQSLLKEVAEVLLEREILDGQQLHGYLDRVHIPPLLATWLQTGEISIDPRMVEIGKSLNSQHLHENSR